MLWITSRLISPGSGRSLAFSDGKRRAPRSQPDSMERGVRCRKLGIRARNDRLILPAQPRPRGSPFMATTALGIAANPCRHECRPTSEASTRFNPPLTPHGARAELPSPRRQAKRHVESVGFLCGSAQSCAASCRVRQPRH